MSDVLTEEVETLRREVKRLRDLIKSVEVEHEFGCPWCNREPRAGWSVEHTTDCEAFTVAGEVR